MRFSQRMVTCATLLMVAVTSACHSDRSSPASRQFRVTGASMAPALCGAAVQTRCTFCSFALKTPAGRAVSKSLVCPNCSNRYAAADDKPIAGALLTLSGSPKLPPRLSLVAVERHDLEPPWIVKRLVGYAGETVSFVGGDIQINDQILQKSPAQFLESAVVVHDDRFRAETDEPRWQSPPHSGWNALENGYQWQSMSADPGSLLEYRHVAPFLTAAPPNTIYDSYGCNQAIGRNLNGVTDLAVQFSATFSGASQLKVTYRAATPWVTATLDRKLGVVTLATAAGECQEQSWTNSERLNGCLFGVWDDRACLVLGDIALTCSHPRLEAPPAISRNTRPPPFAIEGSGEGGISITDLRIHRDLYCFVPTDEGKATRWGVPRGCCFLLGDNLPVSQDSRLQRIGCFGMAETHRVEILHQ